MIMSNRKQRRKTAATAKKPKPLARLGVPIHIGLARMVLGTPDGPQTKFYWWASENIDPSEQEIEQNLHGPFDTAAEAEKAARIACVGPDCELTAGGRWDPAWEKPQ
jgi:hypothetical protein